MAVYVPRDRDLDEPELPTAAKFIIAAIAIPFLTALMIFGMALAVAAGVLLRNEVYRAFAPPVVAAPERPNG